MDFTTVVQGIRAGLEYLQNINIDNLPLFSQEIPLLGVNLRDSLDLALKFSDFIVEFEKDPVSKLNEIAAKIEKAISAKRVRFSFDESVPGKPALRLDIVYAAPAFERDLPLNLDLSSVPGLDALGSIVDVNSTGNLKVKAGADVTLSIGIDVTDPRAPRRSSIPMTHESYWVVRKRSQLLRAKRSPCRRARTWLGSLPAITSS